MNGISFKIMPAIAMLVTKKAKPYLYLPRSINAFYSPEDFKQLIAACGFTDITSRFTDDGDSDDHQGDKTVIRASLAVARRVGELTY